MTQLSLRIAGEATDPEHVAHGFMRQRYEGSLRVMHDIMTQLRDEGRVSAEIDPAAVARFA